MAQTMIRKQRGQGFATSVPILGISNAAQFLTNLIKKQPAPHYPPQTWIGYKEYMRKTFPKNFPKNQTGGFLGSILGTVTKATLKQVARKVAWMASKKAAELAANKAMAKLGKMRLNRGKGLKRAGRRKRRKTKRKY